MTIEPEICFKSLIFIAHSVQDLIGSHGANTIMRMAGRKAAENLLEGIPLKLPTAAEAVARSAMLLKELEFVNDVDPQANKVVVQGDAMAEECAELNMPYMESTSYFTIGVFEGFARKMSDADIQVTRLDRSDAGEEWQWQ